MPKTKAKKTPSKRKPNAAFMRPVQPDDKLSAIVGSKPLLMLRILTKKLWDYTTKKRRQDGKKRISLIIADDLGSKLQSSTARARSACSR